MEPLQKRYDRETETFTISEDEAKLIYPLLKKKLAELHHQKARVRGQVIATITVEEAIESYNDISMALGGVLEYLCKQCGSHPDQWCKMDCSYQVHRPPVK